MYRAAAAAGGVMVNGLFGAGIHCSVIYLQVFRHLKTGDILLLNRQPTLHKPSIMAHKVCTILE